MDHTPLSAQPDFRALFEAAPGPYLILAPDLVIVAVNDAYLRATMTVRERIVGRPLFEVFPDNPADPSADGVRNLRASLDRVRAHLVPDAMAIQKYDIRRPEAAGGGFEERYWSPLNTPVLRADGTLACVIHHAEDVTELVRARARESAQERRADEQAERGARLEGELFLRARQLEAANEQLRAANGELTRLHADLEARVAARTADLRAEVEEHERTGAELQNQREKLRVTLESIGDAVLVTDTAGRVVLLNRVAEALTGWRAADALGAPLADVFRIANQLTRAPVESPVRRVLDEGVVVGLANHTVLLARDGTECPIDDSAAPIRGPDGTLHGVVLIFRDVSARYAAEEAVRRERALLRTIIDSIPDLIFSKDADRRFDLCNRALVAFVGADPTGKTVSELFPPDRAAGYDADDRRVLAGETLTNREELARDAAGRDTWRLVTKAPLRDGDGRVIGLVGISRDIQERKGAEDALRASESRLRAFLDATPAGVCEITPDGRYLYGNAAFYRMFGYGPDEVPRLTVPDILFARERADVLATFARVARGEIAGYEGDRRYRRKDGSELFARVSVVGVRDRAGATVALAAVVVDLTEWRRLEGQFREAQKLEAVGRLAGGVAHDFNNLLTVINGYSDLLLGALGPGSPHRDAVAAIRDAGTRAAGLTGQLLAFSRKAIVEPKVLDLNAVIEHTARLLRRLVGEDVVLTTVLAPDLHRVRADPTQLDQIVLNLAVNARDAMPTGGRLTIETRNRAVTADRAGAYPDLGPGAYVEFVVSDSGTGMTDEVKARLFEPFFTTKEQGKGTGLGLAMVYGAVKTHGGHIGVESAPGAGSTFTILLPATTDAEAAPRSGEARLAPRGTETVLVAEDDDTVRKLTRIALEGQGYVVLEAAHPAAALERAAHHPGPIHLLVTDVVMPGTGGRELARALCAARPGLKVLYVSGYTDDAVVRHGIVAATDAFLQKPFSPLGLVRKVRAVLDGAP